MSICLALSEPSVDLFVVLPQFLLVFLVIGFAPRDKILEEHAVINNLYVEDEERTEASDADAENITEYAQYLKDTGSTFSEKALSEIHELRCLLGELYEYAIKTYNAEDFYALGKANVVEEEIDDFTKKMEDNHISRLSEGICSPSVGAQYLSLSSNAERVGDHLINVAKTIRALAGYTR